jgi:hypothetical protein
MGGCSLSSSEERDILVEEGAVMKLFGKRTKDSAGDLLLEHEPRSRRELLAGAAGVLGVIAAEVIGQGTPAYAGMDGDVVLGAPNNETTTTSITNSASGDGLQATGGGGADGLIGTAVPVLERGSSAMAARPTALGLWATALAKARESPGRARAGSVSTAPPTTLDRTLPPSWG